MANKHISDKTIDVKQEEEERESQPKSVGVKRPRKDFDDSSLREELRKRGVSAEWLDKHPNLAECGRRYKMKKIDATIVLTPLGPYYHVNSFDPDAEGDDDDDEEGVVVDISNPNSKEIDRTYI